MTGRPAPVAGAGATRTAGAAVVAARRLVVIAASTGGPAALAAVVPRLPGTIEAALLLVQHMPPGFTASLASRLDAAGPLAVHEAAAGELVTGGRVLVAPGDVHLVASPSGRVRLPMLPSVNGVRPSADVTLASVAPTWRDRLLAVILTGMGVDGRAGCRAVRSFGGTVFAQDPGSSAVWGMPGSVVEAGLADEILPLDRIADAIAAWAAGTAGPAQHRPPMAPGGCRSEPARARPGSPG